MSRSNTPVWISTTDHVHFEVDRKSAQVCQVIAGAIADDDEAALESQPLPLTIASDVFAKILEYCQVHREGGMGKTAAELENWDKSYIVVDQLLLFKIIHAADYLDCESLLNLACGEIAKRIRGLNTEQMREFFGVSSDFSASEEAEIAGENTWADDITLEHGQLGLFGS